jgi:hypothetical protein
MNNIIDELKEINKKIQARDIEFIVLLRNCLNLITIYDQQASLQKIVTHILQE